MPRLSDSMDEGTIVAWLVEDGARVAPGDEIVEIETDKATMAWAVERGGILRITAGTGDTLPLGATIARIETEGEPLAVAPGRSGRAGAAVVAAGDDDAVVSGARTTAVANGSRTKTTRTNGTAVRDTAATGTAPGSTAANGRAATGTAAGSAAPGDNAAPDDSPTALDGRSPASTAKVDAPTADPAPTPTETPNASAAAPTTRPRPASAAPVTDVALREPTRIERVVARRMVQSRTEIPEFTVTVEIDMAAALALRSELKAVHPGGTEKRVPSVNDLIVKACAIALREHPRVNSAWIDDRIARFDRVNVGIAVSTDDDGLVVPVVADADGLTLGTLAARTRDLTRRARAGKITPPELSGGTFTVSNLGMLGVAHFTAIISPGQGAILAIGSTTQRYVPVDGQPVLRPIMTATLSSDHRVIYGAHAAAFLDRLRTILEHPGSLAL